MPGLIGNRWWSSFTDPITKLWQHDRPHLSVFALANLFFGQAGLFIAILFFFQSGIAFGPFWHETVSSGALYTFAIALTASVLASIVFEFVDGQRTGEAVPLWQHKLSWSVTAAVLVFCQAALVGGLLSSSNGDKRASMNAAAEPLAAAIGAQPSAPSHGAAPLTAPLTWEALTETKPMRAWLQVLLWILSMLVALQLFCLSRLPFIRDNYARERSEDVTALTTKAENITTTPFGEKL